MRVVVPARVAALLLRWHRPRLHPNTDDIITDDLLEHVHELRWVDHIQQHWVARRVERLGEEVILNGDVKVEPPVREVRYLKQNVIMYKMDKEITEIYKMVDYLSANGKEEWVYLLHGITIYIEEAEEAIVSESETEGSEDDYGCVAEGVPNVKIDEQNFAESSAWFSKDKPFAPVPRDLDSSQSALAGACARAQAPWMRAMCSGAKSCGTTTKPLRTKKAAAAGFTRTMSEERHAQKRDTQGGGWLANFTGRVGGRAVEDGQRRLGLGREREVFQQRREPEVPRGCGGGHRLVDGGGVGLHPAGGGGEGGVQQRQRKEALPSDETDLGQL